MGFASPYFYEFAFYISYILDIRNLPGGSLGYFPQFTKKVSRLLMTGNQALVRMTQIAGKVNRIK
jgi:hypothetical protein